MIFQIVCHFTNFENKIIFLGNIPTLNDFAFWYHIGTYLYNQCHFKGISAEDEDSLNCFWHWKLSPMFIESNMPIEEPIVSATLSEIINQVHKKEFGDDATGVARSLHAEMTSVEKLCRHLRERNHDLFAFIIAEKVRSLSNASDSPRILSSEQVLTLLTKLVNSKQEDLTFACSLLTHLSVRESLKVLNDIVKRLGFDYSRLLLVGEIGSHFCDLHRLSQISSQFSMLVKNANWGKKLEKFGVSFKGAFSGDRKALKIVLKELASHRDCTFSTLEDFCRDFAWSKSHALSCFLSATIRSGSTQLAGEDFTLQDEALFQKISSSCKRKINSIIAKMKDKNEVKRVLREEFSAMSSYQYEMLQVLIYILNTGCGEDDLVDLKRVENILRFLKSYRRRKEPGDLEVDSWQASDAETRSLPRLAHFRLPFHEICREDKTFVMGIVQPELHRNTVDKWVAIATAFKMNPDQLYFLAVQNTVSEALEEQEKTQEWQLCGKNGKLLSETHAIILRIKHGQFSTACANWVVGKLPPGKDKVDAAKKCFQLASHCLKKEDSADAQEKMADICQKFQTRYYRLAIEHVLHKYGLAEPRYLSLIKNPEALIFCLYEHPCLSSMAGLNARHMIDINGCATQICDIMNFNQVKNLKILSDELQNGV